MTYARIGQSPINKISIYIVEMLRIGRATRDHNSVWPSSMLPESRRAAE